MELKEIRTATITKKGQITIPKEIRKLKIFKTGEKVVILTFKDHIELKPLKHFNKIPKKSLKKQILKSSKQYNFTS